MSLYIFYFFFFSSRRRHTRSLCDWSSDVCSSDLARARRLGDLLAEPLDEPGRRRNRHEIGLGEVAVVLRLLLRPPGSEDVRSGVVVVGLLDDLTTGLPDAYLALDLGLDPARDEVERVHVLDLAARAVPRLPHLADG